MGRAFVTLYQGISFFGRAFVADVRTLEVWAKPLGVAVVVRTGHGCAGPQLLAEGGDRQVLLWRGRYRADRALRSDVLARCSLEGRRGSRSSLSPGRPIAAEGPAAAFSLPHQPTASLRLGP
ncbi:MAG TPA: hypothetical protein VFC31_11925 [Candidatus Limnocylindria bacterium]|nr:hypothetical protein [Candidatus Limnocylindria bacterium]